MRDYFVYILTDDSGTTYTGFTSALQTRVWKHKHKVMDGFTKKYNVARLVYYEWTDSARGAIEREKQIKSWRRAKKIALVRKMEPDLEGFEWRLRRRAARFLASCSRN
jgi:putative endonuclease